MVTCILLSPSVTTTPFARTERASRRGAFLTGILSVLISFSGAMAQVPRIVTGGVVNAANFQKQLAPGSLATVYGTNLASGVASASAVPLPLTLGGASLLLADQTVPSWYASPTQVNIQIPWELTGQTEGLLTDTVSGATSAGETINLSTYAPGIFAVDDRQTGAIVLTTTGELAAPRGRFAASGSRPATAGEYVSIYCTGLGPVRNTPVTGEPALANPLSDTIATPRVSIGGVAAKIAFSGLTPGTVGLYQVNVQVPLNVSPGDAVPLLLSALSRNL